MRAYRIVNVFTVDGDLFSGNPLCVFEDARGMSDSVMQALARQMNLSETTFVLPSERGDAQVRIFTPSFEMPFAGHPTLGTASVVAAGRDRVVLDLKAGLVPVTRTGDAWTLRAALPPETRPVAATRGELASMLGLPDGAVSDEPAWTVRFFFTSHGSLREDPATGSACANLGGWHIAQRRAPMSATLRQGDAVGRPSKLELRVDADDGIYVTGSVIELGRGTMNLA